MRKKLLAVVLVLSLVFALAACGKNENGTEKTGTGSEQKEVQKDNPEVKNNEEPAVVTEKPVEIKITEQPENPEQDITGTEDIQISETDPIGSEPADVVEPIVNWSKVYERGGIIFFLAEMKNPNSVPIDINFDLTFYLDGKEYSTEEGWYANCIAAGETILVQGTPMVPLNIERKADMKFSYCAESLYYTPVKITAKDEGFDTNGELVVKPEIDGDYVEATIDVVYFWQDGISWNTTLSYFPGLEEEYAHYAPENYDRYEIYAHAYNYK